MTVHDGCWHGGTELDARIRILLGVWSAGAKGQPYYELKSTGRYKAVTWGLAWIS